MKLEDYGWTEFFAQQHEQWERENAGRGQSARAGGPRLECGPSAPYVAAREAGGPRLECGPSAPYVAARVIAEHRGEVRLVTADGERRGTVAGRLSLKEEMNPVVGDWVVCQPTPASSEERAVVISVLQRRTKISRKVAGARTAEQVVAANVDTVFLVMGLDGDYNLRRIERLLALAWESGASPVVLLNKSDLTEDADIRVAEVEGVCPGTPVHATSCIEGGELRRIASYLEPRQTIAVLGSSGVGKSTLINRLMGRELIRTAAVRVRDDRGQHTTVARHLVRLPNGALLIDNPGIRELQLWGDGSGLDRVFEDVQEHARRCRFADCRHESEPGCAVREAVERGDLPADRLAAHAKLRREARYLEMRHDEHARRVEGRRFGKIYKAFMRQRRRLRDE